MASVFTKVGNRFVVAGTVDSLVYNLPPKTFVIREDQQKNIYLEEAEDLAIPSKIYGNPIDRATRIANTFVDRTSSTGILLTGQKGSGKTMLAKFLSKFFRSKNLPTILVDNNVDIKNMVSFVASLGESILIFDEFEKMFNYSNQEQLLSLFDGVNGSKKLFVFTSNSTTGISSFMYNRPGRIYYHYHYENIDPAVVREFCEERLKVHLDQIGEIEDMPNTYPTFNFDMLQAVVEEMNRFGERLEDVLKHLNIKRFMAVSTPYTIHKIKTLEGVNIPFSNAIVNNGYNVDIQDEYVTFTLNFDSEGFASKDDEGVVLIAENEWIDFEETPSNAGKHNIRLGRQNIAGQKDGKLILKNNEYIFELEVNKKISDIMM